MSDDPEDRRRTLYGRRRGRPLRTGRQTLVETLLPQLRIEPPAAGEGIDPFTLFPSRPAAVWLEIGFGGGEHLAAQAAAHPEIGVIGCEPYLNGVGNLLQHVDAAGLTNVRILMDDARLLLAALPDASLDRVFILFPDPWPKVRHHRRRMVSPWVLDQLGRVMRDGAELRLATDHVDYGRWMLAHSLAAPDFVWLAERAADWLVRPADWPETRYEAKARNQGRSSLYFRFRRLPRPA